MTMEIPKRNAYNLGQLYYMMERSVAVSGYLFGQLGHKKRSIIFFLKYVFFS